MVAGGGERCTHLFAFSHLTIHHASLSRRSTVIIPTRDTSNIWSLITCFAYVTETFCSSYTLPVSPPFATIYVSPRIAIVLLLLSSVSNFSMPHSSTFLISPNTSRSYLYISHLQHLSAHHVFYIRYIHIFLLILRIPFLFRRLREEGGGV